MAELLSLSWDEVQAIMERAVGRGLKRCQAEPVAHIGWTRSRFANATATSRWSTISIAGACCMSPKDAATDDQSLTDDVIEQASGGGGLGDDLLNADDNHDNGGLG